jgi:hypothetical protein
MSKEKNTQTTDEPILTITGTVLRAGGGAYEVDPHDRSELAHLAEAEPVDSPTLLCSVRGLLKHGRRQTSQPVSVGDNVRVRVLASSGADARGRRLREGQIEECCRDVPRWRARATTRRIK